MGISYVQSNTLFLAGSGVIVGATTIVLTSLTDIYGNVLTMTDFGDKGYITLEPDTNNEEAATFTTIVHNANGTFTLGNVKTGLAVSPYTETAGLVRSHAGGTKVVITDNVEFWNTFANKENDETIDGQWTFTNTPITPPAISDASTTVKGVTKLSVAPVSASNPIAVGVNDTTIFTAVGMISPYVGRTAPTNWLLCDGSAVSRSTYSSLFAVIAPSKVFTVTVASPAVFSSNAHGLTIGDKISLTTTGSLPTGLAPNVDYYIIATGFTSNAFQVALSPTGSAVITSGSQSGTHTFHITNFGKGNGSTTFNVPDLRSKIPVGYGQGTQTLVFESSAVDTGADTITIPNYTYPSQGQAVVLTTTGVLPAGLSLATTYYVIRLSSTTIQFATSQANANDGTQINITDAGSGIATITFTNVNNTIMGIAGGEENHGISIGELASHTHDYALTGSGGGTPIYPVGADVTPSNNTSVATGGDVQHNNMQPFLVLSYIIKY